MNALKKVSQFVGKYMAIIVLLVAAITLFKPSTGLWIKGSYIQPLLQIIMFGMGLTLKASDFKIVFSRPKEVIVGCLAQFTIMPLLAFGLTKVFNLDPELAIGVVLVGTCPGGTSSNVITYLSKGDVALSVAMTGISTLLAPFLTPLMTFLLAGNRVDMDAFGMFLSIVKVVIVPIVLGIIINYFFRSITEKIVEILPMISIIAIVAIVASVVSSNSAQIFDSGLLIMAVVVCHNVAGYILGLVIAKILGFNYAKAKAVSIEVGMQNSGLAVTLAKAHFATQPMAAVPGAIFSVWHNISGAVMANIYSRIDDKK